MSEVLIIPDEVVISRIYHIRGQKVMLDSDLAELYLIQTRVINQQVKRNADRFPDDFMFQLTAQEWETLQSQNKAWGGRRKLPNVFTEHGVLMLSSILNSKKAIAVNIQIMRIFTRLREMILTHKDLLLEMEELRKKVSGQDERIELIYNYLARFVKEQETPRKRVGFKTSGQQEE
ncbi:MAG: ORF6N domain-containing protein [Flavobacteriales bacterium]|nr:ORF6N domain-containing protein [Flavobacteriales bacterium]